MDQILARITPTKQQFPISTFLTPPDENQPLDFSKRPRLSPDLSPPNIQPRRLQPELSLPPSPLGVSPPAMSPFLLGAGLCFPSLLQSIMSQSQSQSQSPAQPPQPSPPPTNSNADKTELLRVNSESLGQYAVFRQNMLRQLAEKKPVTRRDSSDSSEHSGAQAGAQTEDLKDQAYWERRRKNNLAAKRSRDARRAKEDEIAIRAAFLEQENIQLKWEVARLKTETSRLRAMLLADSDNEEIDIDTTSS